MGGGTGFTLGLGRVLGGALVATTGGLFADSSRCPFWSPPLLRGVDDFGAPRLATLILVPLLLPFCRMSAEEAEEEAVEARECRLPGLPSSPGKRHPTKLGKKVKILYKLSARTSFPSKI